jgi:hypothetical protein
MRQGVREEVLIVPCLEVATLVSAARFGPLERGLRDSLRGVELKTWLRSSMRMFLNRSRSCRMLLHASWIRSPDRYTPQPFSMAICISRRIVAIRSLPLPPR